ncbi:MAG TPA: hypothetical protein DDW81_06470 [Cryomorphaceae bacterium]|nr:hypothetical protein [Owenweeksia sp.]HBF19725.1 hypothetical protein [Cryomorphaceae bacterium]HCQ16929.1 hypothetical protein [Cryomorphaceae bacterium]|tara:strand:- start:2563 stop:3549 length:987 start_codon:yes stop_codon:yes gene_type:complete
MIKRVFWTISSLFLLTACEHDPLDPDVSDIEISTQFQRFDQAFFSLDTAGFQEQLDELKIQYPIFFQSGATDQFWRYQRSDKRQLELYQETQQVWGDMKEANAKLDNAMKHFYHYYEGHPEIDFYTYISNLDFEFPVLYAPENEVCFAALDLYLGQNQPYYSHLPAYLAFKRNPVFLVRDCIEALAMANIPPLEEQNSYSLLDAMIYHGKILYFLEAMMPHEPDEVIAQYIHQNLEFCQANEKNIWAYFIENNMLFSKRDDDIRRFIAPAPFSKFRMKFDNQTPGQIGHWVGWQIVRSYCNNNSDISLQEMLSETDGRKFLKLSGYKP